MELWMLFSVDVMDERLVLRPVNPLVTVVAKLVIVDVRPVIDDWMLVKVEVTPAKSVVIVEPRLVRPPCNVETADWIEYSRLAIVSPEWNVPWLFRMVVSREPSVATVVVAVEVVVETTLVVVVVEVTGATTVEMLVEDTVVVEAMLVTVVVVVTGATTVAVLVADTVVVGQCS